MARAVATSKSDASKSKASKASAAKNSLSKNSLPKSQAARSRASKARTRSARRPVSPKPAGPKLFGLPLGVVAVGLLGLVIASGVQVASQAHEVRRLHAQLESMGKDYNALLAENSRLTLERGARASFARVEKEAAEKLAMHFPDQIVTINGVTP